MKFTTSKSCAVDLKRHSALKAEPGFASTTLIFWELQTGNDRGEHLSGFQIHRPGLCVCEPLKGWFAQTVLFTVSFSVKLGGRAGRMLFFLRQ